MSRRAWAYPLSASLVLSRKLARFRPNPAPLSSAWRQPMLERHVKCGAFRVDTGCRENSGEDGNSLEIACGRLRPVRAGGSNIRHPEWSHSTVPGAVGKSSVCLSAHSARKETDDFLSLARSERVDQEARFRPEDDHAA